MSFSLAESSVQRSKLNCTVPGSESRLGGDELVDLVDLDDRPVGKATIRECLRRGLLHRAVAVLVVRGDGRILLQQRNLKDHWQPGRWTLSCTGHVRLGESYSAAAKRELYEELGLKSSLSPLTKLFLPKVVSRGETEREVVTVFISETDAPVNIDPVELEQVKGVTLTELASMMKSRGLTPDAKILLNEYSHSTRSRF